MSVDKHEQGKSKPGRRRILKGLGGAAIAGTVLPQSWTRPVVNTVVLPTHADMTPTDELLVLGGGGGGGGGAGILERAFDYVVPKANAGATQIPRSIEFGGCISFQHAHDGQGNVVGNPSIVNFGPECGIPPGNTPNPGTYLSAANVGMSNVGGNMWNASPNQDSNGRRYRIELEIVNGSPSPGQYYGDVTIVRLNPQTIGGEQEYATFSIFEGEFCFPRFSSCDPDDDEVLED